MNRKFRRLIKRRYRTVNWWTKREKKLEQNEEQAYIVLKEKYLKASREHYKQHLEKIKNTWNRLIALIGPKWYQELSNTQRRCMDDLASAVHLDIGQGTPERTRKLLIELGISLPIKNSRLMTALKKSAEDPKLFLWELYIIIFDKDPQILLNRYILESRLILSSIFYLGLNSTIEEFARRTLYVPPTINNVIAPSIVGNKNRKKYPLPKSPYLQPMPYMPKVRSPSYTKPTQTKPALPLPDLKEFKEVFQSSINLKSLAEINRTCPSIIKTSPKVFKRKKRKRPHKAAEREVNGQMNEPNLNSHSISNKVLSVTSSSSRNDDCITNAEKIFEYICDKEEHCGCIRWFPAIIDYFKSLKIEPSAFSQSKTVSVPSKIFPGDSYKIPSITSQMSLTLITNENSLTPAQNKSYLDTFQNNISKHRGGQDQSCHSETIPRPHVLLKILLAEQAAKGCLLALLPDVHKVPVLKEWARKRLKGEYTQEESRAILRQQKMNWDFLNVNIMKIRIPKFVFSQTSLDEMNWEQRICLNKLVTAVHKKFHKKLQRIFINAARLWWSSMSIDKFPNEHFRNIFFAYMPSKEGLMLKTGW